MKKISKRLFIYLKCFLPIALFLILPFDEILPCGPGPAPSEFYIFTAESISQFYSNGNRQINNASCSRDIVANPGEDSNIQEWTAYLGLGKENTMSVKDLIYGNNLWEIKAALGKLKSLLDKNKNEAIKKSGKLTKNTAFIKAVQEYKKDALTYLVYAKECEKFVNSHYDYWQKPKPVDSVAMIQMEERGISERNSISDPSIKMRYAFQIIRLSHYRNDFLQTIDYFKRMKIQNTSSLYYRILSLYAGALAHMGDSDKARYFFGLIATQSADYGSNAKIDFKSIVQNENSFQITLSYAKDKKEQIEIYKARAETDNSITLDDLRAVRDLKPDSTELESILLYQIARIEKNLLNRFYSEKKTYPETRLNLQSDHITILKSNQHKHSSWSEEEINSLRKITSFISETLEKFKVCNPYIWNITGAYLSLLDEDYQNAELYLKKAESMKVSGISSYLAQKEKELGLMYELMSGLPLDSLHKDKYAATLNELYGKQKVENLWYSWSTHQPQMYIHRILKQALEEQNQENLALLISDWSGFNLESYHSNELEKMLALIEKKEKDPLEHYIVYQSGLQSQRVASRLASTLIKENHLDEAIELISRIQLPPLNKSYIKTVNPFESPLTVSDNPVEESQKWDKKSFASHMLLLQNKLSQETNSEQKAALYLEIGNGWYNISHFGSWWIIVDDSWSYYDKIEKYRNLLIKAKTAWLKSGELSGQNKELGTEALFLAALSEREISSEYDESSRVRKISAEEKMIWDEIRNKYSGTSYFTLTVKECYYYRQFNDHF